MFSTFNVLGNIMEVEISHMMEPTVRIHSGTCPTDFFGEIHFEHLFVVLIEDMPMQHFEKRSACTAIKWMICLLMTPCVF